MATTENLHNGTGSQDTFPFTFPYLKDTDIKVSVGGILKTVTTHYTLHTPTTIKFTSGNIPPSGTSNVRVYRETADTALQATFYPGSAIRSNDLNDNFTQNLYVVQENNNRVDSAWQTGDETIISTEAWHTSDDTRIATTKAIENRISTKIDTAIESDILVGNDLTKTASNGQVTIAHSVTGAGSVNNSNGVVIQDLTINGRGHVTSTGSLDLDSRYYTETELDAGQLDNRYYTETEADARFYNLSSVEEIQSGETWVAADNKVATTSAIDARIVDLVDDVGGFVPIANETSFPNANPDVNNGAGTLVSIKALSNNLTSNGSGVATISNGTVGNSTVTINGLENSTTYGATLGMIVETTSTLNTYTFHRVTPKATEVTTVASNIASVNTTATNITNVNTFANVYRIASSAPGSNNDDGDLYYNTSDNKLYVYNGSAWEVAASLNGSGGTVTGDITFSDNTKLELGTGSDLQIYHDGSHSYIDDTGTGNLKIKSNKTAIQSTAGEDCIVANENGAVELYYDNSKKFETRSGGVKWTGNATSDGHVWWTDDKKAQFGADNDLEIYHDGSASYIQDTGTGQLIIDSNAFEVRNAADTEYIIKTAENGAVELYYDNSKKFETHSGGINVTGSVNPTGNVALLDDSKLKLGTGDDLQIYHDGSNSFIKNSTNAFRILADDFGVNDLANGEQLLQAVKDGAVDLYYDNSKKIETTSSGISVTGNIVATTNLLLNSADDQKIYLGAGNDLQIYHDGTYTWSLDASTGGWHAKSSKFVWQAYDDAENMAIFHQDGACRFWYDGSEKLATNSEGIEVNNHIKIPYDGGSLKIGASNDFQFFHTAGGYNTIYAYNGDFRVYSNANKIIEGSVTGGAVELYYDNAKKLETHASGITVSGTVSANAGSFVDNGIAGPVINISGDDDNVWYGRIGNETYHDSVTTGFKFYVTDSGSGRFYHTGNAEYKDWLIGSHDGTTYKTDIWRGDDGTLGLYHDGNLKLITTSGGVTVTGSVTESSDIALKNDINTIQNPLELIEQIRGIDFTWKNNGTKSMGVIAQDVEKVFPELVHGEEGSKAVQYSGLIGALVESVKELSAKVAALESS